MHHAETVESVGGRGMLVGLGIVMALLLAMLFRPRPPSPFTAHGAYGAGFGSQSLMFGANPRAGAPRLR